ncbi:MAG: hypothetical protein ACI30S_02870, partial [Muribaculaceae bacterium]
KSGRCMADVIHHVPTIRGVEIRRIDGGRDTSRPYDKRVEIRGIDGGREASRPYDKRVEIRKIENSE